MRWKLFVLAAGMLSMAGVPSQAGQGLYEANYAFLAGLVPPDETIDAVVHEGASVSVQRWTAQEFVAFRAEGAARAGIDYTAAAENAPQCLWIQHPCSVHNAGDIIADLWGTSPTLHLCAALSCDADHGSDHDACGSIGGTLICSTVRGWFTGTSPVCYSHHLGKGVFVAFGAPYGGFFSYTGSSTAEALNDSHAGTCTYTP